MGRSLRSFSSIPKTLGLETVIGGLLGGEDGVYRTDSSVYDTLKS